MKKKSPNKSALKYRIPLEDFNVRSDVLEIVRKIYTRNADFKVTLINAILKTFTLGEIIPLAKSLNTTIDQNFDTILSAYIAQSLEDLE